MIEILHTPDAAHAEIVRLALEAEGIKVRSVDDTYDPYLHRHVLSVSEADATRAIDIRRRVEQQDAAHARRDPPLRKGVVAGMVAFWIGVYLLLRWYATH